MKGTDTAIGYLYEKILELLVIQQQLLDFCNTNDTLVLEAFIHEKQYFLK